MFHFKRRIKDPFLEMVDLAVYAPFAEGEHYLLIYPVAEGVNIALVVVYEARSGERVHVVHSPGMDRLGAGQVNFAEWIATAIRKRDPHAVAMLTSRATDEDDVGLGSDFELVRNTFEALSSGRKHVRQTIVMGDADTDSTVLNRDEECLYTNPGWRHGSTAEWSRILGTPIRRFSSAEWDTAADKVDPDRSIRAAAKRVSEQAFAEMDAFFREMGIG